MARQPEIDPNRVIVRLQNELAEAHAQKARYAALVDQLMDEKATEQGQQSRAVSQAPQGDTENP